MRSLKGAFMTQLLIRLFIRRPNSPQDPRVRAAYGTGLADDELARQILGDAWFVAPSRWLAARTSAGATCARDLM